MGQSQSGDRVSFTQMRESTRGFFQPSSLDRKFTYKIPRTVTVQDARMGISYYAMFLGIFIFVLVYQMGGSGGHIAFESVFGQVSFQLKRPTSINVPLSGENSYWNMSDHSRTSSEAGFLPIEQLPYCLNKTGPNRFCSDDPANTSFYCIPMSCAKANIRQVWNNMTNTTDNVTYFTTSGRCKGPAIPMQVQECRYVDEELVAPVVQRRSVLIVSRMSWMQQNLSCQYAARDNESCVHLYSPLSSTQKYHTVQPENFQIMFDHEVFTPTNGVHGKQQDNADAPFEFSDGRTYWPAWIDPAGNGSFYRPDDKPWIPGYYSILGRHTIEVNTLLQAAGLDTLDKTTGGLFDAGSTYRYTGITVMLRITYNNYEPYAYVGSSTPSYTYKTQLGTTYAAVHTVTWNGERSLNGTRLFENRHGIKIVITQEGRLGVPTLVNLMIFFGSALAIFAAANIIVDQIVIRFVMSARTKKLLELAQAETVPTRAELLSYMKSVEDRMGGNYEPPENYWELESELIAQAERDGKKKARPNFKETAAVNLQQQLEDARVRREQSSQNELKTAKELQLGGALAFVRTISEPQQVPELHRNMSNKARTHWKMAKDGVYGQMRAANGPPGLARVRTALASRKAGEASFMGSIPGASSSFSGEGIPGMSSSFSGSIHRSSFEQASQPKTTEEKPYWERPQQEEKPAQSTEPVEEKPQGHSGQAGVAVELTVLQPVETARRVSELPGMGRGPTQTEGRDPSKSTSQPSGVARRVSEMPGMNRGPTEAEPGVARRVEIPGMNRGPTEGGEAVDTSWMHHVWEPTTEELFQQENTSGQ